MLVGGAVALWGIALAVRPMVVLYRDALADPLGQPEGREARVPGEMMRGVWVGAAGVVPFAVGGVLVKGAARRRIRAALSRRGER